METHWKGREHELVGTVQRECWRSREPGNDFVIASLEDGTSIKGLAPAGDMHVGGSYRFFGWFEESATNGGKTYGNGKTFRFSSYTAAAPHTREGITRYLQRHCEGIGPGIAGRLFDLFGTEAAKTLRENPELAVQKCDRLRPEVAESAAKSLAVLEKVEGTHIELVNLFAGKGFPRSLVDSCVRRWKARAAEVVRRNPFALLTAGFPGVGFQRCDQLFLSLRKNPAAIQRQFWCVWDRLASDGSGSTWVSLAAVRADLTQRLGSATPNWMRAVNLGLRAKRLRVAVDRAGQHVLALAEVAEQEERIAHDVARLLRDPSPLAWPDLDEVQSISDHQRQALEVVFRSKICCLLGSPGTGKTWTVGAVVREIVKKHGAGAVALAAPTAKAASVLKRSLLRCGLDLDACTTHRLLGVNATSGQGWAFEHNADNPLNQKFIFIDEASMPDIAIGASLFSAIPSGAHVCLIGDTGQLTSVGRGALLRDLLAAGVPHFELTEIRRNAGAIVEACRQIKRGQGWSLRTSANLSAGHNLIVKHAASPEDQRRQLVRLVQSAIARGIDVKRDLQVLVALNDKTQVSRTALNPLLQDLCNPQPGHGGKYFRLGDKVTCTRNQFFERVADPDGPSDLGDPGDLLLSLQSPKEYIANGEVGEVIEVGEKRLVVRFEFPRRSVAVPVAWKRSKDTGEAGAAGDDVGEDGNPQRPHCDIELAYAMTVHKAQGSSARVVIYVTDSSGGARRIGCRELVYTAISRAEELCVVLGDPNLCVLDAKKVALAQRKTLLAELLRETGVGCSIAENLGGHE
jgi:exodeoxyribonuclease V alpha subunit